MKAEHFDDFWEKWGENPQRFDDLIRTWNYKRPLLDLIVKFVEESYQRHGNAKVLEVGCGSAMEAYYIAKNTKAEVFAIDLSSQAIEVARKFGDKIQCQISLKVDNATRMGFKNESFHIVFSQGLMEHFLDPLPLMREQLRVLRKGGYLIVDVPQRYNFYTLYKKWKMGKGQWPYGWEKEYSAGDLKNVGKRLGINVVAQTGWGNEILHINFPSHRRFLVRIIGKINRKVNKLLNRYFPKYSPYYELCVAVVYGKR